MSFDSNYLREIKGGGWDGGKKTIKEIFRDPASQAEFPFFVFLFTINFKS